MRYVAQGLARDTALFRERICQSPHNSKFDLLQRPTSPSDRWYLCCRMRTRRKEC